MITAIFYPSKGNLFIYINAAFLILLMVLGTVPPITVVFAYFLETIIIGILNVLKMFIVATVGKDKKAPDNVSYSGYAAIPFFIIHYGFFVFIQSVLGFSLFEISGEELIRDSFAVFDNYALVLNYEGMGWVLASILASNLGYFINNFLIRQKYREYTVGDLMIAPYVRIFIQQFVVIFSGFLIIITSAGIAAGILLVAFRTVIDLVIAAFKDGSPLLEIVAKRIATQQQPAKDIEKMLQKITE